MRYVLGKFELHTTSRRLYFDNDPIQINQRGLEILLYLIERQGEVATKSELLEAVWPGEQASESRLVKQISLLRQAIESLTSDPSIIVTVSGFGYRTALWEAKQLPTPTAERVEQGPSPLAAPRNELATTSAAGDQPSGWGGWLRVHWRRVAVAIPMILFSISVFLTIVSQIEVHYKFGPSMIVKERPINGFKRSLNFSNDGRALAYYQSVEPDGTGQFLIVNLADKSVTTLPGDWSAEDEVAWSPDNRSIALLHSKGGNQVVRQLSISSLVGQQVRQIGEVTAGGIDWAPNGQQFAVCAQANNAGEPDSGSILIHLLATDGSRRQPVTRNSTGSAVIDAQPRFSPDGSRLAFIRRHRTDQSMEIRLVDLATREERSLLQEPGEISDLEWSPNGAAILFLSDRNGQPRLWRVSTADGAASPVPSLVALVSDPIQSFSISAGGELAYVCLTGNSSQIDLIPLPKGPLDSLFDRREGREYPPCTICSRNSTYAPTFSPDGSQIAFISTESGTQEIWVANADCTNYRQLTFLNQSGLDRLAWSGDGTRIAFDQRIDGQFDLFYLDLGSGQIHRLTDSAEDEFSPVWSAKSDSIYYSWRRNGMEGGTGQIRQWVLASNQTDLLVEGGDGRFLASANPEQLFFRRRDHIWRKNLQTGEEKQLASLDQILQGASWEIADDQIYLIKRKNQSLPALFRRDLLSGRTQEVMELDLALSYSNPGFAISPNRRAIASASISACAKEIRFLKYLD